MVFAGSGKQRKIDMKKRKDDIALKLKAMNRVNDAVLKGKVAIVHVPEDRIVNGRPRTVFKRIVVKLPKRTLQFRYTHNELRDGFDVPKTIT